MTTRPNLALLIADALGSEPETPFLMDSETTLNRGQFLAGVAARQRQLAERLKEKAPRVLVSGGRGIQGWVDTVAVWGIGGTVVPLGAKLPEDQVPHIVRISDPAACLGGHPGLAAADMKVPIIEDPILSPEPLSPETGGGTGDPAAIVFTSGTTGEPKGVALTHDALIGNAGATREALALLSDDRLFMAIPFNFASALFHFIVMSISGAQLYATEARLMVADLYAGLRESGATCFGGSPMQLRWIAACAEKQPIHLRWAMSSGDHLPTGVIADFRRRLPETRLFTVYGMTELSGRFCILPPEMHDQHAGAVGKPIRGLTVRVLDEDMRPVAKGEIGEVYASGDYLMMGYYGNTEETAATLTDKGVRTGDMGCMDENGLLHLCGRADDVFKCNGEKVSALPIIEALMETGMFADVAVQAWEDPVYGTVPRAFYVLKDGGVFDKGPVVRHLRKALPGSHLPRVFTALDAIPRTGSGKVKRAELRRLALDTG